MNGKLNIQTESPKTQSVEAVKALLAWKGRASDPLPSKIEFTGDDSRLMLILSNDKKSYYVTTARACSCPSAAYRPGQTCKHQRKYFPQIAKPAETDSIRPKFDKSFRPFSELPSEERAAGAV